MQLLLEGIQGFFRRLPVEGFENYVQLQFVNWTKIQHSENSDWDMGGKNLFKCNYTF